MVKIEHLQEFGGLTVGDVYAYQSRSSFLPVSGRMEIIGLLRIEGDPVVAIYREMQTGQVLDIDTRQFCEDIRSGVFVKEGQHAKTR